MAKNIKDKTNVEFIKQDLVKLMEQSRNNPVFQAFVIQALTQYSEQIIATPIPQRAERSLISPELWKDCAVELKALMDSKYTS